ncbi:dienelactone hydrolase family protein [Thauera sinica]|uniref:Alpha/beta hydrolase n=1 Tax=Thauera sinica TaxID=2665146 RepID=A0ABW1AWH5_9RHOO|nr:alpha/beta hydrolase [Thauera sp. K11]ATE60247.1 alpha/beta hydrolase [Thauera sp. K11]
MKLRNTLISIPTSGVWLDGRLAHAPDVRGLALLPAADGYHPPNVEGSRLPAALHEAGFATMTLNLLTRHEAARDPDAGFNVSRLTTRLLAAIDWIEHQPPLAGQPLGLVAGGTTCGALIRAAGSVPDRIAAMVCLAGRPDLAGAAPLRALTVPTRFIVSPADPHASIARHAFALIPRTVADWHEVPADDPRPAAIAAAQWLASHLPVTGPA